MGHGSMKSSYCSSQGRVGVWVGAGNCYHQIFPKGIQKPFFLELKLHCYFVSELQNVIYMADISV